MQEAEAARAPLPAAPTPEPTVEREVLTALTQAAVAAVRQWVFKPALSNNKPVAVWVAVPVKFTLTIKGGISMENGALSGGAGAIISVSPSASNQTYTITLGTYASSSSLTVAFVTIADVSRGCLKISTISSRITATGPVDA